MSNQAVIRMPKRFDYSSSVEFNSCMAVALEKPGTVTLDCMKLEYIDSAGIGLLVMSQKKAQAHQSKIVLINLKPSPKEILHLANLQKIIDFN